MNSDERDERERREGRHPHARLYASKAWQDRRKAQLAREPLCAMCKARGRLRPARLVDHVTPHRGDLALFYGGEVQSLCWSCHSGAKQREENAALPQPIKRERKRPPLDNLDGTPADPAHPWYGKRDGTTTTGEA